MRHNGLGPLCLWSESGVSQNTMVKTLYTHASLKTLLSLHRPWRGDETTWGTCGGWRSLPAGLMVDLHCDDMSEMLELSWCNSRGTKTHVTVGHVTVQ